MLLQLLELVMFDGDDYTSLLACMILCTALIGVYLHG
jgi:hypothetical protein